MKERRVGVKAGWIVIVLISGLAAIVFLSRPSWLIHYHHRSGVVLAQTDTSPSITGFNISRTVLSHGRVGNARQQTAINPNGLRDVQGFGDPTLGTPGLLTAIATP